ncbi:MAG: hypothetical protein ABI599_17845 [Flavobacteriales bacterium]
MNDKRLHWVACMFSTAVLLIGCRKDRPAPRWDVEVTAPLVTTSLSVADALGDSLISVGDDGVISVLFTEQLFALSLDTVLDIPDTVFSYGEPFPFLSLSVPPGYLLASDNEVTRFDLEDVLLSRLDIREGIAQVSVVSSVEAPLIMTFGLPGATRNGVPFEVVSNVPAATPGSTASVNVPADIAGYRFDLRGPSFDDVNTLATEFGGLVDPTYPTNVTVTNQDSVVALVSYSGMVPQYARGYFGQRTVHLGPEVNDISSDLAITANWLDIDRIAVRLKLTNGIGVDGQVQLNYLTSQNSNTGQNVDLNHAITTGTVQLNRAIDLGYGHIPSISVYTLDETNSNVDLFVENLPDVIGFEADLTLNPLGNISNGNDFLYYDSKLSADLEVEIPLCLAVNGLQLQSIAVPDLPGTSENHGLREGELMLFAMNGFPFDASMQLEIIDADWNVLSNVPVAGTIASGLLGTDGFVETPVESKLTAPISEAQVDMLYNGGRLRITSLYNTANQPQQVKILDRYRLDLQVTVRGTYTVNGDE